MNKRIFWLVGEQCAGKTLFAKLMVTFGAQVLNIGEKLRETTSAAEFAKQDNAYAPAIVEQTVHEMVLRAIHDFKRSTAALLVIDSAPRNMGQLKDLVYNVQEMSMIVFITEEMEIRRSRAIAKYNGDLSLFNKREPLEAEWIQILYNVCNLQGIQFMSFRKLS